MKCLACLCHKAEPKMKTGYKGYAANDTGKVIPLSHSTCGRQNNRTTLVISLTTVGRTKEISINL